MRDAVVLGDLLLHVLLQEGHIAQEAASEGSQQLKEQLNLRVVASEGKCTTLVSISKRKCVVSTFSKLITLKIFATTLVKRVISAPPNRQHLLAVAKQTER